MKAPKLATTSTLTRTLRVREYCRIGHRVILQNGVVVGGDGYGFAKTAEGTHFKIVQSGITVMEDDVEIQTLTSVDRATVGETRVKRGAKIDSLVQVGHASVVGEDNIICAQTGLAGSSILGKNVLLAGQVGHLRSPHHSRQRHRLRAERHRRRREGRRDSLRLARFRKPRVAARHHRVSETARPVEDSETIGKAAPAARRRAGFFPMIEDPTHNNRRPVAYLNETFLESPDARGLRILSEYLEPLSHFRDEKIQDTIVFFGSARITEDGALGQYYNDARTLARLLTEWSNNIESPLQPLRHLFRAAVPASWKPPIAAPRTPAARPSD
jgi:carbonic anhydrase/acetyltransferase-like protein (isoleucine patch superfamily)